MVKKTTCNIKIRNIENEIPSVTALVTTAALNIKATYIEKIHYITDLTTKASLNTKATDFLNKISDTTGFITTLKFNRLILM